jgi:hypothetical protein
MLKDHELVWVIDDGQEPTSFWSNDHGWTSFEEATRFTNDERWQFTHLPIGGEWLALPGVRAGRVSHTPGPWEYANSGLVDVVYAKDSVGADRRVCELIGPDGVANGLLIAALPELLAVVRELIADVDEVGGPDAIYNYGDDGWYDIAVTYEHAMEAIRKAEGGAA